MVAFCADNTPANFGSANHTGPNNVFQKLKAILGNLLAVGCPCHIMHNAARKSADNLCIDFESIVFKLASYFRNSTQRVERLKDICDELEVRFKFINYIYPKN